MVPEKGWESRDDWHKASGWRDFKDGCGIEEESSWKEREGDSTGESTDQMKSLAVLQSEVQDMKNCLNLIAANMVDTGLALQTTKEEACEAKERIVTLEAQVAELQEVIGELLEQRRNCPPSPASGAVHPHAGRGWGEEREAPPCNEWHEHVPSAVDAPVDGKQEQKVDDWLAHLRTTLSVQPGHPRIRQAHEQDHTRLALHRSNCLQDTSQPLLLCALPEVQPAHLWHIWQLGHT